MSPTPGGTYNGLAFDATATVKGLSDVGGLQPRGRRTHARILRRHDRGRRAACRCPDQRRRRTPSSLSSPVAPTTRPPGPAPVTFTIGRASETISLASSGGSAVYGQPVTFLTTVGSVGQPGAAAPTGTVTFFDGATPLATVSLDSAATAVLTTSVLAVGAHSITAIYNGADDFLGTASGSASESVAQAGTEVVLVPHAVMKKKRLVSVNLTAEIEPLAPGGGTPTGMVAFELLTRKGKKIKTDTLGRVSVTGGQATVLVKASSVLNKSITIVYGGDTDFRASTDTSPKLSKKGLDGV